MPAARTDYVRAAEGVRWGENAAPWEFPRTLRLFQDGRQVGEVPGPRADFPLAREAATYRLVYEVDVSAVLPVSTRTVTDDGATWAGAPVRRLGGDRFQATLPAAGPGTAVSLRVDARGAGGSRVEQAIIRAYRTAP